jgi:hypothetical protein
MATGSFMRWASRPWWASSDPRERASPCLSGRWTRSLVRRILAPLQRDCVLALSRGGRYTLGNVVPVCRSCNTSTCNAEVTGWLRRKRLDERAFLLRHLEINAALDLQFQRPDAQ